jgi:hypothetical protein
VPSIGTFVRATLVAPVVFGSIVMQPVMGVVLTGNANCDASGAIANGALNDCTTALAHGSECTPTCDTGYVISGIRSCSGGTLIDTAVCISSPYEHGRRLLLASSWTQVGGDIDGEAADDKSGNTVSMSSDGTRMAIGAKINDNNGNDDAGHVRVYSESGGTWTQLGGDIDGEAAEDDFGYSVSMSSDGTRVAIGGRKNDGTSGSTSDNRGHVRVYEYDAAKTSAPAKWAQVGGDIDGEAAGDESGRSISMSSDGTRVAIGARGTMGRVAPHQITAATCACTLRAAGRGPRWVRHRRRGCGRRSGVCIGIDVLGRHARGDRRFRERRLERLRLRRRSCARVL